MAIRVLSPTLFALLVAAGCGGSTLGSIGAVLGRDPETGAVHVRDVPKDNAADRAGLLPGDELMFVDGRDVRDLGVADLRKVLRGEPGTRVDLTVLRGGRVVRMRVARSALVVPPPRAPEGEEKLEE